jgi:hypothetical protein
VCVNERPVGPACESRHADTIQVRVEPAPTARRRVLGPSPLAQQLAGDRERGADVFLARPRGVRPAGDVFGAGAAVRKDGERVSWVAGHDEHAALLLP